MIPDYREIVEYVLLNMKLHYSVPQGFKNACLRGELYGFPDPGFREKLSDPFSLSPEYYSLKDKTVPVFLPGLTGNGADNHLRFDPLVNAFLLLSGIQEWICKDRDRYGRFPYRNSLQHKYNFAGIPVVNDYFELISMAGKKSGYDVQPLSPGLFRMEITHDIDQLNGGWMQDLKYYLTEDFSLMRAVKTAMDCLRNGRPPFYRGMQRLLELESKSDIKSLFFFIPEKSAGNADYCLSDPNVGRLFDEIYNAGSEAGIHPAMESYKNEAYYLAQKEQLEHALGKTVTKNRQHFLQTEAGTTWRILEKAGIRYDYTLGFAEMPGFRNSVSLPFYPFDFDLKRPSEVLCIPLYLMDSSLTAYSDRPPQEHLNEIPAGIKKLKDSYMCHFSVLFHNTAFRGTRHGWLEELFFRILEIAGYRTSPDEK